jgi:hypothetical protein
VVDDPRRAPGERVRGRLPEDVTHVRARRNLEHSPAHPHLRTFSSTPLSHALL